MHKSIAVLLLAAFSATPPLAALAGPIVVPGGLHPGNQYRLAFVTSTTTTATSTTIANYNSMVALNADSNSALATLGTTWSALVSTGVAARDNTLTNYTSNPTGVPIYTLANTLVASTYTSFWSTSHNSAIDTFADGTTANTPSVWTGTGTDGQRNGAFFMGNPVVASGEPSSTNGFWIVANQENASMLLPLYAISGTLTVVPGDVTADGIVNGQDIALIAAHWLQTGAGVPGDANGDGVVNGQDIADVASNWLQTAGGYVGGGAAVPEPSTLILAALGGLALLAYSRRTV